MSTPTIDCAWPLPASDPLRAPAAELLELLPASASMPPDSARRIRRRLTSRVARALQAGSCHVTLRREAMAAEAIAPGVTRRQLYASRSAALRPGEPALAAVLELARGARWTMPDIGASCLEWLVLRGGATVGEHALGALGYLRSGRSEGPTVVSSADGAALYLRQIPSRGNEPAQAQRDTVEAWLPYGPGILRRLLWNDGQQAAMLYRTSAGAAVPHHGHRHDEECLMIAGELFLDDVLLRPGDYQLAPAGTEHSEVSSDTGCLLFAHGDLDLALMGA